MNVAEREAKIAALRRELRLLSDATSRREAVRDEIAVLEAQRAMPTRRRPEEEDSVRYGRHELEPDKPRVRRLVVMEPLDGLLEQPQEDLGDCPDCGGTGSVRCHGPEDYGPSFESEECERCGGGGTLPEQPQETSASPERADAS